MEKAKLNETIPIEEATIYDNSDEKIMSFVHHEEPKNIFEKSIEKEKKYYQIKKVCVDIIHKNTISLNDFDYIHQLAVSKGGFLSLKLRTVLWQKIFGVNNITKDEYELVFIDEKKETNIFTDPYKIDVFYTKKEKYRFFKAEDYKTIDNDVKRSKINSFPHSILSNDSSINDINEKLLFLKKKLKIFINTMTTLNNSIYKYYQGYHDIGLYFIFLYMDDFVNGICVFQRFSEFFLKENLVTIDDYQNFNSVLLILKEVITKISPITQKILDQYTEGNALFAISWILSLYSHNVEDLNTQYRLFDYFIVSHPICVYHLTALIIIDQMKRFHNRKDLSQETIYLHFQELNMDKIDFDAYIIKTEESMKQFPLSEFRGVFEKVNMKR